MGQHQKIIAENTLQILEQGYYMNAQNEKIAIAEFAEQAINKTALYNPEQLDKLVAEVKAKNSFTTQYEVTNETTLDAARRINSEHTLVLNFASAKNPGGGFLGGAVAQEESIARASALYPCLLAAPGYYHYHKAYNTCLYSDHMIYSPRVPVFKYEDGTLMEQPLLVTVVTSPAVNAGAVRQNESSKVHLLEPVMRTRTNKLLALCATNKHSTLVLGAWGCGVFQNDPEMIAGLFHELLKSPYAGHFARVIFAVKTSNDQMLDAFRKRFGGASQKEAVKMR